MILLHVICDFLEHDLEVLTPYLWLVIGKGLDCYKICN